MADLSSLGNLAPVETLDVDETYVPAKESTFRLPAKGEYTLRAPESFPTEAFGTTKAGHLSVQIDPTIVGPTNENFQLRFQKVSAKPFERGGVKVSQAGDYLRANGFSGRLTSVQDIADAVEATAGNTYKAQLDWRAYNSQTGFQVEGMEKFPKLEDGSHQSWIEDPTSPEDADGKRTRVPARLFIRRFIAAS